MLILCSVAYYALYFSSCDGPNSRRRRSVVVPHSGDRMKLESEVDWYIYIYINEGVYVTADIHTLLNTKNMWSGRSYKV